ncbi:MAG: sigma-70 family RNA polymerase sigma factor [Hydrogenothermaceae bacterium]
MKQNSEKKKIVEENLQLVKKVASKIYAKLPDCGIEFDDLVQVGVIGLIKAIDSYKQDRAQFSTYAYIRIRGEILDFLRSLDIMPHTEREKIKTEMAEEGLDLPVSNTAIFVSLDKVISEEDESISFIDTFISKIKTPEDEYSIKELIERINDYIDINFSEKDKKVIHMLFFEEKEPKEISESLGISLSRISQIKNFAIAKLKSFLYDIT